MPTDNPFAPPGFTSAEPDASKNPFAPPDADANEQVAPANYVPQIPALNAGLGLAVDLAGRKNLPNYLAKTPERAIGGLFDILRGAGLGLAAGVNAVTTAAKLAPLPGNPFYDPAEGANRLSFGIDAGKAALPEIAKGAGRQLAAEVTNPFAAWLNKPTETTLDYLAAGELPSSAASVVARVAAKAGMKDLAMGAMRLSEGTSASTRNAAIWQAMKDNPHTGPWVARQENIWRTRDYIANRMKEAALTQEVKNVERADRFGGLSKQERAAATPIIEGRASPFGSEKLTKAVESYKGANAEEQARLFASGELDPATVERRAAQPLRVALGGDEQLVMENAPLRQNDVTGIEGRAKAADELHKKALQKAASASQKEADATRLQGQLTQARRETQAATAAEKRAARFAGRSEQAQKRLGPIEDMAPNDPMRAEMVARGTDVTRAELGLEGAQNEALASRAAIPGTPENIAGKLGKTKAQLSEAQRWQRVADVQAAKRDRLLALADAKRGRTPALDRIDAVTQQVKERFAAEPDATPFDPAYVPAIGKPKLWDRLVPHEFKANLPAYLRRSTGETLLSPERELDIGKISAIHDTHVVNNQKNLGILKDITSDPQLSRPLTSPRDPSFDPARESIIAPGAYARNMVDAIHPVDAALRSPDPHAALDAAARSTIIPDGTDVAGLAESMGPFYAVPKEVAHELNGQMGGWYAGLPPAMRLAGRLAFDTPNQFLRLTALTLRPGFYVNNLVGNTAMAGLAGATGKSVAAAIGGEAIPTIARGAGFAAAEAPALPGALNKLGRVSALARAANEGIDELARGSAFLGNVDRMALRKSILQTGTRMDKAMSYAEKMEFLGPQGVDRAAKEVSMFLNDYANQAPWQRNVLRNVLPFQSFLVHMTKLIARMPATHPLRAALIASLSEMSNDYQKAGFEQAGIDPGEVKPYRKGLLPVSSDNSGTQFLGSAGFNPTSGLGTNSAEMAYDPSPEGLARSVAGGAGPLLQYGAQIYSGKDALGSTFTKPGVYRTFGIDQAYDNEGNPIRQPVPSPWDYVRQSVGPIKMLEAVAQPNETYDLTGNPFSPDYLPEGGAPNTGTKSGPRAYDAGEMLQGYLGFPYRTFNTDELVISDKEKKVRERIATQSKPEVVGLRKQIKEAEAIIAAAKLAKDSATIASSQARLKSLQQQMREITKKGH